MGAILAVIICFKVLGSMYEAKITTLRSAANALINNALTAYGVSMNIDVPESEDDDGNIIPAHTSTIIDFEEPFRSQVEMYRQSTKNV